MLKITSPHVRHAAPIFAALGDDVRLALVGRLADGVPLSITRLSDRLPITRQAVTKHLHILEEAGLAKSARSGREQQWLLQSESLKEAQRYLDAINKQWTNALQRLKAFVEEQE
ncbi:MAG TPA: helix-turn-helix domain-containing protein [Terriglobales bacterium]|nr:helix-turn-helix domain-containing protein [Terriglobales bacterium]